MVKKEREGTGDVLDGTKAKRNKRRAQASRFLSLVKSYVNV